MIDISLVPAVGKGLGIAVHTTVRAWESVETLELTG